MYEKLRLLLPHVSSLFFVGADSAALPIGGNNGVIGCLVGKQEVAQASELPAIHPEHRVLQSQ